MNKSYTPCTHPEISVIIPTYYRQFEVSELFDSILRQIITPVEVIVVDDHTPNDTIKILCEEYRSKFKKINTDLRYLRNLREQGLTAARNVGIGNASGDIISFIDSDMILHPEFIEKILEVFKDNSNALGVQGWFSINTEYRNSIRFLYSLFAKIFHLYYHSKNSCKFNEYPVILTKIINCTWMSGGNMAFKRSVFNEFRFDESLKKYCYMEDRLFSHSIFQKYPKSLFITPYAKLIHNHSKKGRMKDEELKEHKKMSRKYVLSKLFGFKGLLIYHWQNLGMRVRSALKMILQSRCLFI